MYKRTSASDAYGWGVREDEKRASGFHYGHKSGLKLEKLQDARGNIDYQYTSKGSDYFHETSIAKDIARLRFKAMGGGEG